MPEAAGKSSEMYSPFGVRPLANPFALPGAVPLSNTSAPGFASQQFGQVDDGSGGEPGMAVDTGESAQGQIAYAENLQSSAMIAPGSAQELNISFGKGQYRAWVRVTNQESWSSRISPPERRSPLMGGPKYQVDVRFTGDIASADRMHERQISLKISDDMPPGRHEVKNLNNAAPIQGPGWVRLHATNAGPHPMEVVLGAYL